MIFSFCHKIVIILSKIFNILISRILTRDFVLLDGSYFERKRNSTKSFRTSPSSTFRFSTKMVSSNCFSILIVEAFVLIIIKDTKAKGEIFVRVLSIFLMFFTLPTSAL